MSVLNITVVRKGDVNENASVTKIYLNPGILYVPISHALN